MMQSRKAEIEGLPPGLLMHRFPMEPIVDPPIEKRSREGQAEIAAYRDDKGRLFVPGINLQRAFVSGGVFLKGKGRASLTKQVAACVFVSPSNLLLGKKEYEIDSRPVVIPATKGRIVRHRPLFPKWKLKFTVEWDDSLLTGEQIREVVDVTGSRVGLLDFRPEKKGPFGRFIVIKWEG